MPHQKDTDKFFMRAAIAEARKGLGRTSPNPPVGAVLVKNGEVVARAHHRRAGEAHAEIEVLTKAGEKAGGAEMYVTLEPCDHHGCTPPCSLAVMKAGVSRVVLGCEDPNPLVSGRGIKRLKKGGVDVSAGVLEKECSRLIEAFTVVVTKKRSHVTIKAAVTLDGKISTKTGHSRWISGDKSLALAHRLRNRIDAILVGASTVRKDDPSLTCRMRGGRDPIRIILSNDLKLSPDAKVFHASTGRERAAVIVATTSGGGRSRRERAGELRRVGAEIWTMDSDSGSLDGGSVGLKGLLEKLAGAGVNSVLVEGGARVHGAFFYEGLCDRVVFVVAPKIMACGEALSAVACKGPLTMAGAVSLREVETCRYGDDVMVSGVPDFSESGMGEERTMR